MWGSSKWLCSGCVSIRLGVGIHQGMSSTLADSVTDPLCLSEVAQVLGWDFLGSKCTLPSRRCPGVECRASRLSVRQQQPSLTLKEAALPFPALSVAITKSRFFSVLQVTGSGQWSGLKLPRKQQPKVILTDLIYCKATDTGPRHGE